MKHTRRRHKVDHKTGRELEPKAVKVETPSTPAPVVENNIPNESADPLLSDFSLNKSEEYLLQQNLFNLPVTCDDKFVIQQQIDLINGTNSFVRRLF